MKLFKNKDVKKIAGSIFLLLTLIVSIFLSYGNIENFNWRNIFDKSGVSNVTTQTYDAEMQVHFLDVGKADCAYIKCGDKHILIDAADVETNNNVVEYLKRQCVPKFDLVVVSHPHRDHIGQMDKVINEFEIDRFIIPEISDEIIPTSVTYEKMLKSLINCKVNVQHVTKGKNFLIGDMKIEIFGPINEYDNLNNNSIVSKITYGNVGFLFTGDAEKQEEADIINSGVDLKSTILKVAHHGSNTSSTQKFLGKILPEYAVISVGPDRSSLPKDPVLERLRKFGIKIYRTDLNGNIIFLTDGGKIDIVKERK